MNGDDQQQVPSPFQSLMAPQQQPQQQGGNTLQTLLMTALPALSAMLTSSRWEGRGAATGRGIAAGLAGYAAAQPRQKTGEERYWDAKAKEMETQMNEVAQMMRDPKLQEGLSTQEKYELMTVPKEFFKNQTLKKSMDSNKKALTDYFKVPAEVIPDDPKTVSQWLEAEIKASSQGKKFVYKQLGDSVYALDPKDPSAPPRLMGPGRPVAQPSWTYKTAVVGGENRIVALNPKDPSAPPIDIAPAPSKAGTGTLTPKIAMDWQNNAYKAWQREPSMSVTGDKKPFDEWYPTSPWGSIGRDDITKVIQGKTATAQAGGSTAQPTPGAATHRYNPATGEIEPITP